jgi:hypothetical protein
VFFCFGLFLTLILTTDRKIVQKICPLKFWSNSECRSLKVAPRFGKFPSEIMSRVRAQYSSPTHSLEVSHPTSSSEDSQKGQLDALRQAILSTQADLNAFLTERKLEEDQAGGVNGPATSKRKAKDEEGEEEEENGEEIEED